MKPTVLLIGDGPFAHFLAKRFTPKGYTIIMTTINEESSSQIRSKGYIPIYASNLHEDGCEKIYEQCMLIIKDYSLALNFIIHTARGTYYEHDGNEPPADVKAEMFEVNAQSPSILAKYFYSQRCKFVFISSCATTGFKKSLACHALPDNGEKRIGTNGIKYYSYTKRLGEENLYNFFREERSLPLLIIPYISIMLGTNFFKDMGIPDPDIKGYWNAERTADYIVDMILKGKKRIYPGWQSKAMSVFPRFINRIALDSQQFCK